jgi:hypothetical protein
MGMNMERQMWQTSRSTMWKMAMGSLLAAGAGWMMDFLHDARHAEKPHGERPDAQSPDGKVTEGSG